MPPRRGSSAQSVWDVQWAHLVSGAVGSVLFASQDPTMTKLVALTVRHAKLALTIQIMGQPMFPLAQTVGLGFTAMKQGQRAC